MSEELRCHKLSKMLDFEVRCEPFAGRLAVRLISRRRQYSLWQIKPSQLIQAHTILKSVAHKYAESPVLVIGGKYDVLRKVAEG